MIKSKPCKICDSPFHTPMFHKPRKPIITRKRPPKIGRVAKETAAYVTAWKLTQQPDSDGLYTCYISGIKIPYCMAEHPYSKARHPELRTKQKLEPVAAMVNKLKGSMDIGDFLVKFPEYQKTVKAEYLASIPE